MNNLFWKVVIPLIVVGAFVVGTKVSATETEQQQPQSSIKAYTLDKTQTIEVHRIEGEVKYEITMTLLKDSVIYVEVVEDAGVTHGCGISR